ncbi:hypothetical protein A4X13_0g8347, partial [Tilletia indica]
MGTYHTPGSSCHWDKDLLPTNPTPHPSPTNERRTDRA